ncbi:MAG: hypothetical protein QOI11_2357, partial [Candidatus Eremiobacteraeota bacterium]|nr:hypothetical protein [Candidatus Eremiobacteraeota bacterium]
MRRSAPGRTASGDPPTAPPTQSVGPPDAGRRHEYGTARSPEVRLHHAWRVTIMDRYLVSELGGPFAFGLSAFTLIFVATQLLAIGRLVSEQHAPLWAAVEYFLWDMPQFLLLVI